MLGHQTHLTTRQRGLVLVELMLRDGQHAVLRMGLSQDEEVTPAAILRHKVQDIRGQRGNLLRVQQSLEHLVGHRPFTLATTDITSLEGHHKDVLEGLVLVHHL